MSKEDPVLSDKSLLKFLKDYWPIILGIVAVILAWGETRWQVRDILKDIVEIKSNRQGEIEQWRRINANEDHANEVDGRLKEVEKYVTPESIQRWGEIQRVVEDNRTDLRDHLRNHGER